MAKVLFELTNADVHDSIPYQLVCETRYGSRWNTMHRKRRWKEEFTEKERETANRLFHQSLNWALRTGVPGTVRMSKETIKLWQKLGDFCATI